MTPHAIVLRISITPGADIAWLSDALGECARELERAEVGSNGPLGLVLDPDDPGRYAWSIVKEAYS